MTASVPFCDSINLVQDRLLGRPPLLVWYGMLASRVPCAKPSDVALVDRSVTTTADDYGLVVTPVLLAAEPTMDHHVAGKAQMVLIGLAGGEWLAVILSVPVDDAPTLPASDAPHRSSKRAGFPLTVQPCLRTAALTP